MGVAQKNHVLHLGSLSKIFGISGAPMEHNTTAKSKQTFLLEIRPFWHKQPGLYTIHIIVFSMLAACS